MFKRIAVLILLFSTLFVNIFSVAAHADIIDATKYHWTSLFNGSWFTDYEGTMRNWFHELLGWDCNEDNYSEAYNDYASNLPLNGYDSDGGLLWMPTWDDAYGNIAVAISGVISDKRFYSPSVFLGLENQSVTASGVLRQASLTVIDSRSFRVVETQSGGTLPSAYFRLYIDFIAPVSGMYVGSGSVFGSWSNGTYLYFSVKESIYTAGSTVSVMGTFSVSSVPSPITLYVYAPVFRVTPSDTSITNNINIIYAPSTRIANITFNIATVNEGDEITNVYQDVKIVNEETNIFTNPATGESSNIKSWTYDYTTRTYTLELEDGSIVEVTFGDDGITIKVNGEIQNEFKYVVEDSTGGGDQPDVTPTPAPSVTPAPTDPDEPTPTPGPGDGDDHDHDGFHNWLKDWLIDFKEWLGEKLDALLNKDTSPGDTIYNEFSSSTDITNNYDYTINYTDEDGNEKDTSLRDLIHKFDFLRDIYEIGQTLISMVSADAAAAYAYDANAPDETAAVMTIAATDDGIMPIANPTGAPSLKINLGAANSHYGIEYGGEVEFLDLSWYTPYKPTVDSLISGFLWFVFAWGLFKQAPSIISGASIIGTKVDDIREGERRRW